MIRISPRTTGRATRRVASVGALLCLAITACAGPEDRAVRSSLGELVGQPEPPGFLGSVVDRQMWGEVREFYGEREGRPAWVRDGGLSDPAEAFVRAACTASGDGLDPARYGIQAMASARREVFGADSSEARARALARLELLVGAAVTRYAGDLATGRGSPRERGAEVHLPPRSVQPSAVLRSLAATGDAAEVLASLRPPHQGYARLRAALARYRLIEAKGGWPSIPEGEYRRGDRGEGVAALRKRLVTTEDLGGGGLAARLPGRPASDRFDEEVEAAVRRYQGRHGLEPTGAVDSATLRALNVPVTERIRQIELNLERWRLLPSELGERHIVVNVPAFHLEAHERERVALEMPVIVGEQFGGRSTPVFSDTLSYIVFSPYWWVPESIARDEIIPRARRDPGFFTASGYELVSPGGEGDNGEEATGRSDDGNGNPDGSGSADPTDLESFDWSRVGEGGWRVRQRPGPRNALGRIKFVFPNEHAVYLHDTPDRELFERTERTFSHGCIRVGKPAELAAWVLGDPEWTPARVEEAMSRRDPRRLDVAGAIPVYILYLTAFVDDAGAVSFRRDIYGYDEMLARALAKGRPPPEEEEAARKACRAF